jgi:predicted amidophosphoribosyltransferase
MARAAMACDPQLMAVIHRFKYAGKTQLARPLGGLMLSAFMRHWKGEKIDLLLPVPLHAQKFRHRGFNQSFAVRTGKLLGAVRNYERYLQRGYDGPVQQHEYGNSGHRAVLRH